MERNLKECTQRKAQNSPDKRARSSGAESEEGEIEDEDSDFDNHDTSERDSC